MEKCIMTRSNRKCRLNLHIRYQLAGLYKTCFLLIKNAQINHAIIYRILLIVLFLLLPVLTTDAGTTSELRFKSAYDDIDWDRCEQYQMDMHAHARRGASVEDVLRFYDNLGYGVVSFKDRVLHYPMAKYVDDPNRYQITLLPGQNIKPHSTQPPYKDHLKLWFSKTDYKSQLEFEGAFVQLGNDGGLIVFAHPASGIHQMYSKYVGAEWYIDYFDRYPHVLGIEINNHDMEGNRKLFDELLSHYGAKRRVVGFGGSDLMGPREDGSISAPGGFGLSIVISEDRKEDTLREAIEAGRVLWVDALLPDLQDKQVQFTRINSIHVETNRITVNVSDPNARIDWIHANKVIGHGSTLTLDDVKNAAAEMNMAMPNYVRFEVSDGAGATLGSQAFYIIDRE